MQESVGAFEARTMLAALLDRVERGEEIIISRRGRPVARLVPLSAGTALATARAAAASLRALAGEIQGPPMAWEELRTYRCEGRR